MFYYSLTHSLTYRFDSQDLSTEERERKKSHERKERNSGNDNKQRTSF